MASPEGLLKLHLRKPEGVTAEGNTNLVFRQAELNSPFLRISHSYDNWFMDEISTINILMKKKQTNRVTHVVL
jgi:hypothetical protein